MDKSLMISKATEYILSIFGEKGFGLKKIGTDVSDAVSNEVLIFWSKVKPLFIEEIRDEKLLKLLIETPKEERTKAKLTNHLYDRIDDNPVLENELQKLVEQVEQKSNRENSTTINQNSYGSGHNIGRDYIAGNQTKK